MRVQCIENLAFISFVVPLVRISVFGPVNTSSSNATPEYEFPLYGRLETESKLNWPTIGFYSITMLRQHRILGSKLPVDSHRFSAPCPPSNVSTLQDSRSEAADSCTCYVGGMKTGHNAEAARAYWQPAAVSLSSMVVMPYRMASRVTIGVVVAPSTCMALSRAV
jgi:hypothetical protein